MASQAGRTRTSLAALSGLIVGGGFLAVPKTSSSSDAITTDEITTRRLESLQQTTPRWKTVSLNAQALLLPSFTSCKEKMDPAYPDLSRYGMQSYLKRYLTPEIFKELKDKTTSNGVTLEDLIQSGVTLPSGARPVRGCGIYAGDAESYQVFAKLLDPILEDWHHFRLIQSDQNGPSPKKGAVIRRQVTNLNPGYVLRQRLDPTGEYILQARMRVARSVKGFPFSPKISRQQRRELEALIQSCVEDFDDDELEGKYTRVMDMSNDQHDDLIQKHILFHDPDALALSAGNGRDWPDARGIYMNESDSPEFMIWMNAEDHLRVISMSKGGDLLAVFTRLSKALKALEAALKKRGHCYATDDRVGYLNTSPENLGSALRASVFVKLVRLGQQPGFEDLLTRLRLESSTRFKGADRSKYTGIFDIANSERLGQSEVQLINTMINGVGGLIALEKRLERGETINLDDIDRY
jgi:creatine kinase